MLTHQEVQMVSGAVCRKVKEPRAKMEKQKERDRERRETVKVGMTAKVGQSERDGLRQ